MIEALELLVEGAEIKAIERAAKNFGMPMGPLALYDVVGLDTAFFAGRVMYEAFPDRIVLSPVVGALIKAGRLGQKSGAGFFSYARDKERGDPDPKVMEIIAPYMRKPEKFTAGADHRAAVPADAARSDARARREAGPRPARRRSGV